MEANDWLKTFLLHVGSTSKQCDSDSNLFRDENLEEERTADKRKDCPRVKDDKLEEGRTADKKKHCPRVKGQMTRRCRCTICHEWTERMAVHWKRKHSNLSVVDKRKWRMDMLRSHAEPSGMEMPAVESSRDRARERDVAAAANQLAVELAPEASAFADPELLRVVTEYFCSGERTSEAEVLDSESDDDEDEDVEMLSFADEDEEDDFHQLEDIGDRIEMEIDKDFVSQDAEKERRKVKEFKCNIKHNCMDLLDEQDVLDYRRSIFEFSRKEKDLVILAQLKMVTASGEKTICSKRKEQSDRQRDRASYVYNRQKICTEMFRFLNSISRNKLTALKKRVHKHGVGPVTHKAGGKRSDAGSYTSEDARAAANFLINFAEENAVFLPGRVPGYKSPDVKLLPSSLSKAEVWQSYARIRETQGHRVMQQTSFLKVWNQFVPSVVVFRPMEDLCWQCQRNSVAVYQSANLSEEEKEARTREHLHHLDLANQQRAVLQAMTEANRTSGDMASRKLGPNPPCSADLAVHYSFDYGQQVHYPSNPLQRGPMYFLTPRKCSVFGVSCEGVNQQVNFLIDEGMCLSKGSLAVISYLHFFFQNYGLGEKHLDLHGDNCAGQNKSKFLLWYLCWRTLHGLHHTITLNFLLAGHTKFSPDLGFGLFMKKYSETAVSSLNDIADCVHRSSSTTKHNLPQLVGDEAGNQVVPVYQWEDFLAPYFQTFPDIKKYHHFRFSADEPGYVFAKLLANSPEEKMQLLKNPATLPPCMLPPSEPTPALSRQRKEYLYSNIREFCHPDARDVVCPAPV